MKLYFTILAGMMAASSVSASIPSGQQFGSWHVKSMTSESGSSGDDASAMMFQEINCQPAGNSCDELEVSWMQGFEVRLSIKIRHCRGKDENFEQSYSIPTDRWLDARETMPKRVKSYFTMWLEQAELACDLIEQNDKFNLEQMPAALNSFTDRLLVLDK